eukprot:TRINITY_DN2534_c0_g1_i1.p2 TRINITY_DN2534_c0_g1~~TRINITY_DN2534_c0_g1_i1.p2  ORF type:complete len:196 (+),score=29.58 TRINITY_DN2534_c0_g1_i1:101-688(+)
MQLLIIALYLMVNTACWQYGRATYYGNEPWWWTIHYGSCGYGYLCKDEVTGWDVAALPDAHPEYWGSCGRCYEVQCNPTWFSDGYGASIDRSHACRDQESSVVVQITDTCPCNYPTNWYSNKRWCCGDMNHFDLSVWAYEKLAEHKWGVIGIKYRQVNCWYTPWKKAQIPPEGEHWGQGPWDYSESCPKHNRPYY